MAVRLLILYIDVLLVTNFIISYFLFMASSVVSGYTFNRIRVLTASAFGALFCLFIFLRTDSVILSVSIKIMTLIICSATAFGWQNKRGFAIQTLWYIALNMLVTGAVILLSIKNSMVLENNMFFYFDINPVLMVVSSVVIYLFILVFELVKERVSPKRLYNIKLVFSDFKVESITAFYDSGFKVKDIVANKDVIIASYPKLKNFIPENISANIVNFLDGNYALVEYAFVPVFFKTVSGGGMLPAIKAEYIETENRKIKNILVAFTKNELSENVCAIFGDDIKKQL